MCSTVFVDFMRVFILVVHSTAAYARLILTVRPRVYLSREAGPWQWKHSATNDNSQ